VRELTIDEMFAEQLRTLGYGRPAETRLIEGRDVALVVVSWWEPPAPGLLADAVPALTEILGLQRRREVLTVRATSTPDGRHVMVMVTLGEEVDADAERAEALRNWTSQVCRHARDQRDHLVRRRRELHRTRAEIARAQVELRARRAATIRRRRSSLPAGRPAPSAGDLRTSSGSLSSL
jgi:hypothetical protein